MAHKAFGASWPSRLVFPLCVGVSIGLNLAVLRWISLQATVPPRINIAVGLASVASRSAPEATFLPETKVLHQKISPPPPERTSAVISPARVPTPRPKAPARKPTETQPPQPLAQPAASTPPATPRTVALGSRDKMASATADPSLIKSALQAREAPATHHDRSAKVSASTQASSRPAPDSAASTGATRLPSQLPNNPAPVYPPEALENRVEGWVYLRALISAQGTVQKLSVYRSSQVPGMDESALAVVRRWRFQPALRGDTAVPYEIAIPIHFKLVNP
jgi:periplasmic protein TonB